MPFLFLSCCTQRRFGFEGRFSAFSFPEFWRRSGTYPISNYATQFACNFKQKNNFWINLGVAKFEPKSTCSAHAISHAMRSILEVSAPKFGAGLVCMCLVMRNAMNGCWCTLKNSARRFSSSHLIMPNLALFLRRWKSAWRSFFFNFTPTNYRHAYYRYKN